MRKAILIVLVVLFGLFLTSVLVLRHERARQLRLRAESAALLSHVKQEMASIRATDPLYAAAESRSNAVAHMIQNGRSKVPGSWFRSQFKSPDVQQKYNALEATYTLLGALSMLRDNLDRKLLHQFVLNTPRSTLSESDREIIGKIPLRELATLRGALQPYLSISDPSLDDPARLWEFLSTNASKIEPQAEAEAKRLEKACETWPAGILRERTTVAEALLKQRVYVYYIDSSLPPDYQQTTGQRALVEEALHKS